MVKEVFVCLYGVWIDGVHYEYDRWYGYGRYYARRVRRAARADSFYIETMRNV